MISLRELLQDSNIWADSFILLQLKYEESAEDSDIPTAKDVSERYTKLIMSLLSFPFRPNDYVIQFQLIPVDEFNKVEYVDISIHDPIKNVNDDLSALPWSELIDLPLLVSEQLAHYTDADLLAELLWELTTWGFDTEVSKVSKDRYSNFLAGFFRDDLDKN